MKIKLITILVICLNIASVNGESMKSCEFNEDFIEKKFSKLFYEMNDRDSAFALIQENEKCTSNDHEKAVLMDLRGRLYRDIYMEKGDLEYAKKAEAQFLQALGDIERKELVLGQLAILKRATGEYSEAISYINKAFQMDLKEPGSFLAIALEIATDTGDWQQAKELVDILYNKYRKYFFSLTTLFSAVKTLCHYNKPDVAKEFVSGVKGHKKEWDETDSRIMRKIESYLSSNECKLSI